MCLAMCLKKQEFQADCVYKLGVYKKKVCIITQRRPSFKQPFTAYFAEKKRRSADFFFKILWRRNI